MSQVIAIVLVAGGGGRRLGGDIPKQYQPVAGRPVIHHCLRHLLAALPDALIQPVIREQDRDLFAEATDDFTTLPPVVGGEDRQMSVLNGLEALAPHKPELVLVHDAARPFIHQGVIDRLLAALKKGPAALPGLAVVDSVRRADQSGELVEDVDRAGLYRAQTPQGFDFPSILQAHRELAGQGLTDDAAVARKAGLTVKIVEGDEALFKITHRDDLEKADQFLRGQLSDTRVGQGFDVHAFEDGDHVVLGGIKIPHDKKLKGHSDADVALHAITDAILGAIGEGDIGDHFSPKDDQWKSAPSDLFLKHAADLVSERGGMIAHLDVTIICEAPKIGPHRDNIKVRIAEIADITPDRVSVKATTTEKLGFTGRGEGIAAQAVATIRLP